MAGNAHRTGLQGLPAPLDGPAPLQPRRLAAPHRRPVAGALVDRWDRRRTMLAVDLGRAGAILPLLLVHRSGQIWVVYSALLVESLLGRLFDPAAQALVPDL